MSGPDADDFNARLEEAKVRLQEAIRREAFVQGFILAREPKTAIETLTICADADVAYAAWRESRR